MTTPRSTSMIPSLPLAARAARGLLATLLTGLTSLIATGCAGPAPGHTPAAGAVETAPRASGPWRGGEGALHHVRVRTVGELRVLMASDRIQDSALLVPNVAPVRLPGDFDTLPVGERKAAFFRSLLPLVVHENTRVAAQRGRLLEILDPARTMALTPEERRWLSALANEYAVRPLDRSEGRDAFLEALLRRVDAVPVSLALAQAAIESAWGTSRFARMGNAFFGQWTYDPDASGMIPAGRPEGSDYRIETFPSIHASIRGYMRNLNTHRAYREFRDRRHARRRSGRALDAFDLAQTLHRYSARGADYVTELEAIMRQNRLSRYTRTRLVPAGADLIARFETGASEAEGPIALLTTR